MKILFLMLIILFIIIPLTGMFLLIRFIINKSKANQPPPVLEKEKNTLIAKVRSKKSKLTQWKPEFIEELSNRLNFNYTKSFTRKFNGTIQSLVGENLIAFRRLDRGQFKLTSRILAISSDFEIFFEQKENEIAINFNDQYIGKIVDNNALVDKTGKQIGTVNRNQNTKDYYFITINDDQLAYVIKNSDRRTFLRNPFYDFQPSSIIERDPFLDNDELSKLTKMVKLYHELDNEEYKWVVSLIIFEIIYYGIDFLQ